MKKITAAVLATLLAGTAQAQDFQQGPGALGRTIPLAGQVIGMRDDCALVLADIQQPGWEGLGGAGHFYYCRQSLSMGDEVAGEGVQVGTRWARVGPRWRVLHVYRPANGTSR